MTRRTWIRSAVLLFVVVAAGAALAGWKQSALAEAEAAWASQPEPMEMVTAAVAREHAYRPTTTAIGTVLALRSITLRNEVPGTVRKVMLKPGEIVEAGEVLVALDVAVEEAELKAHEAQIALTESVLARVQHLFENRAASRDELDRARAERDIAVAQVERVRAVIARKTIRAPFRARVGISDVHPGQYLNEGTELTTLQGVDDGVHVDFAVGQRVAAALREGERVDVFAASDTPMSATVVAVDARVDPATRNAIVRAKIDDPAVAPAPGASVRVEVPTGPMDTAVAVPVNALRRGPAGDHVFVLAADSEGRLRASERAVRSGTMFGDQVLIHAGIAPGETVAASGSFKLREAVLVAVEERGADVAMAAPSAH